MSLDPSSPAGSGSGRSSPVPRPGRKHEDLDLLRRDKGFRKYAASVEKVLSSFESPQQEWSDYIAFLVRLSRALNVVQDIVHLPHSTLIALRLGQCMNPALPSGVHQKALEVYELAFSILGKSGLARDIHEFLPGILHTPSFASLTVRPLFYSLLEKHILNLDSSTIRPVVKSVILALLPGIEDETSEDFEEGIRLLDRLRSITTTRVDALEIEREVIDDGYFWQCFFIASITSASRRQGALAYLTRRLPAFGSSFGPSPSSSNGGSKRVAPEPELLLHPDPGLLVRCFASGLQDTVILVQRGFLDLLVTHVPLHSKILQEQIAPKDLQILVAAAASVVLRRDMSLNRRLWTWFLGPDSTTSVDANASQPKSPSADVENELFMKHAEYFSRYGARFLQDSIIASFQRRGSDLTRAFRISVSLMDRWEIAGTLVPRIFVPALESVFSISQKHTSKQNDEVVRSASLFFDGVESFLIWAKIFEKVDEAFNDVSRSPAAAERILDFLTFIVHQFNVREEEMLFKHIPNVVLLCVHRLCCSTSDLSLECDGFVFKTVNFVLNLVSIMPPQAFVRCGHSSSMLGSQSTADACATFLGSARKAYTGTGGLQYKSSDSSEAGQLLVARMIELCIQGLDFEMLRSKFRILVDTLCNMIGKCPDSGVLNSAQLHKKFKLHLSRHAQLHDNVEFTLLQAFLALTATSTRPPDACAFINQSQLQELQESLVEALWAQLSPWEPKYHVEAVKSLWHLESITRTEHRTGVQLTQFLVSRLDQSTSAQEECARFATLWEHTMQNQQQPSRSDRSTQPMIRRVSSMANIHDLHGIDPEVALTRPLLVLLDSLKEPNSDTATFLLSWLRQLPSLERVFSILLTQLAKACSDMQVLSHKYSIPQRAARDHVRGLSIASTTLRHILNLLRSGSAYTWAVLAELRPRSTDEDAPNGIEYVSRMCSSLIEVSAAEIDAAHIDILHQAVPVVQEILDSQYGASVRHLRLEDSMISALMAHLGCPTGNASGALQTIFLGTITKALRIRVYESSQAPEISSSGLLSPNAFSSRSIDDGRLRNPQGPISPPSQLLDCLKTGLSSSSSRLYLGQWVQFLSDILPLYFDAIFAAMIPLVECFCDQIALTFRFMQATFSKSAFPHDAIPVPTLAALLHGLELILANAHLRLQEEDIASPTAKPVDSSASFFGSMVNGTFSGAGNKNPKVNSRLTMILCVQDALKTIFSVWQWATHSTDMANVDPTSMFTLSYNSIKLRHRTKRILEHLFAAENLECLETLIIQWLASQQMGLTGHGRSDIFSLLHVLGGSRPRVILPSILNALYSRTSIEALEHSKRSSLTSDLTALDVAAFLLEYISTVEDDAMDEIWADCMTFLKDVLSNPLPHRQVLPALLELVSLLAEKIDNTNIGELRRMHRETGDIFLRLLTANFTARPSSAVLDGFSEKQSGHKGNLEASLVAVTPRLLSVLETQDRVNTAINSISTSVIGPKLRAKSFPETLTMETLELLLALTVQSPTAKSWKKDVSDAFNDPRFFQCTTTIMHHGWYPILRKWTMAERDRLPDLLGGINAPTTAGLMFGVGASAARTDADRKTQTSLRRISLLLLACDTDTYMNVVPLFAEKLGELATATTSSSPSSSTRAEIFMVYRALFLSVSSFHLSGLWPLINDILQAALVSALPGNRGQEVFNNISLLQACHLLDLLVTLAPEEFQLHEWLYITNTIDAVYRPDDLAATALVDEVAGNLDTEDSIETKTMTSSVTTPEPSPDEKVLPFLHSLSVDGADLKAMARDDIIKSALQPFFTQLSMYAYENMYGMGVVDTESCRQDLLKDLLDEGTIV